MEFHVSKMTDYYPICSFLQDKKLNNIAFVLFFAIFEEKRKEIMKNEKQFQMIIFEVDNQNIDRLISAVNRERNGFLLCRHGSIILVMDDNEYIVSKGDLYIYPAFVQTRVKKNSEDFQGVTGFADFDLTLSSLDSVSDTPGHIYIRFHPQISLDTEQSHRIEEMFYLIYKRKDYMQTEMDTKVVLALQQALCYEIVGMFMKNTVMCTGKQSRKDKIFRNFLVALHKNSTTHRDVKFYAELQCMSPRHFATQIREKSGQTPLQWITLFVITEAKRLLANPEKNIKEIADKLNFPTQSSFGRYFKLYTGQSPYEYRIFFR